MDHEEESVMVEASRKEGTTRKNTVDRRAEEARADDECEIEM